MDFKNSLIGLANEVQKIAHGPVHSIYDFDPQGSTEKGDFSVEVSGPLSYPTFLQKGVLFNHNSGG